MSSRFLPRVRVLRTATPHDSKISYEAVASVAFVSVLFYSSIPTFCSFFLMFFVLVRKKNAKSRFFTSRGVYVNLRYIAILYTYWIGNQL